MDKYEKVGYTLLGSLAVLYFLFLIAGMIAAFPWGLIVLVGLLGFGVLLIKVLKERLSSKEDDYYTKEVDK